MKPKPSPQDFIAALTDCKHQVVIIKGSPDPDALAAAYALQCLSEALGNRTSIICEQPVSLPQNRIFIDDLGLALLQPGNRELRGATAYSVVDHQDASPDKTLHGLPCLIHIDHHEELGRQPNARFRLLDRHAGAASSLIALLWKKTTPLVGQAVRAKMASALLAGILTDTDHGRLAGPDDREAMEFLEGLADDVLVRRMSRPALSAGIVDALHLAAENARIYRNWVISGIGFLSAAERDTIAIVADRLLEQNGSAETVIVYAAIENTERGTLVLDASMRSRNGSRNLDRIIKRITPHGGGRRHKAAFQVPLDFLQYCEERGRLWQTLRDATENALVTARSELGYGGFWTRLRRLFLGSTKTQIRF